MSDNCIMHTLYTILSQVNAHCIHVTVLKWSGVEVGVTLVSFCLHHFNILNNKKIISCKYREINK